MGIDDVQVKDVKRSSPDREVSLCGVPALVPGSHCLGLQGHLSSET